MAIIFNKYVNCRDYTWYDSSNVKYSECIDNEDEKKVLKVTFNKGQTYIYTDVDVNDYIMFKNGESTGKSFNEFIRKKYEGKRLSDVDIDELDKQMKEFAEETKAVDEAMTNLAYVLEIDPNTKQFSLRLNGKTIFEGVDNQFSITKLLSSMSIKFGIIDASKEDVEKDGENC